MLINATSRPRASYVFFVVYVGLAVVEVIFGPAVATFVAAITVITTVAAFVNIVGHYKGTINSNILAAFVAAITSILREAITSILREAIIAIFENNIVVTLGGELAAHLTAPAIVLIIFAIVDDHYEKAANNGEPREECSDPTDPGVPNISDDA